MTDYYQITSRALDKSITLSKVREWIAKDHNRKYFIRTLSKELPVYQKFLDDAMLTTNGSNIQLVQCNGIYIRIGPQRKLNFSIDAWRMRNFHLVPDLQKSDLKLWQNHAKRVYGLFGTLLNITQDAYATMVRRCILNEVIKNTSPSEKFDDQTREAITEAIYNEYYNAPVVIDMQMSMTVVPGIGNICKLSTILSVLGPSYSIVTFPLTVGIKLAYTTPTNDTDEDLIKVIMNAGTDSDVSLTLRTDPHSIADYNMAAFGAWAMADKIAQVIANGTYEKYMEKSEE